MTVITILPLPFAVFFGRRMIKSKSDYNNNGVNYKSITYLVYFLSFCFGIAYFVFVFKTSLYYDQLFNSPNPSIGLAGVFTSITIFPFAIAGGTMFAMAIKSFLLVVKGKLL